MDVANNPAGRLRDFLALAVNVKAQDVPAGAVFSTLVGVDDPDDTSTVLARLRILYELPREVREEIEKVPDVRSGPYLKQLPLLEEALAKFSLHAEWDVLASAITPDLLDELEICNNILSRARPQPTFGDLAEVRVLYDRIQELIGEVRGGTLSPSLQEYLVDSLTRIQTALRSYRWTGGCEVLTVVDQTIGHLARRPDLQEEAQQSDSAKKVFRTFSRIAIALTIATNSLQLAEGLFTPSGGAPEQSQHVDVDVDVTSDGRYVPRERNSDSPRQPSKPPAPPD